MYDYAFIKQLNFEYVFKENKPKYNAKNNHIIIM